MKDKTVFSCLGFMSYVFALMVIATILSGFVIQIMWGWFITPLFDIYPPTIAQAIGLSLFVGAMRPSAASAKSETGKDTSALESVFTAAFVTIGQPLILLFLGYIVTLFL